jgi:anti-sigma regulatory factor (Ser/Thr protein kinase)
MSGHELLSSRIAFTAAPAAVRRARHWIAAQLARTDPAELIDAAVLLVSELVTNAVHASAAAAGSSGGADPGRVELAVARTRDTVRIEVSDSAHGSLPAPSDPSADDESGRGLQVITALTRQWGCRSVQRGKVVWCELAAAVQEPPASQPPAGPPVPAGQLLTAGQPAAAGHRPVSRPPVPAGQLLTASPPVASAGCIDLSRPVSVAARYP